MFGVILIVDDHEAVRRGLRQRLSCRPEWRICGEAADGIQGVEKAKALPPAIVLLDVSMPRMDGLELTRILGRDLPESKSRHHQPETIPQWGVGKPQRLKDFLQFPFAKNSNRENIVQKDQRPRCPTDPGRRVIASVQPAEPIPDENSDC